ncbi:MAG: hypothetical protein NTZ51_11160 [Proteobacteria bacterium]|nr:hypothetical protein [Pseudomonadota bacterium]
MFIKNYLKPSADGLDRSFTVPLPDSAGLQPCGEFIVQGKLDNTTSTNIISKFESGTGIRVVEVYKNTEDAMKGIFIRLVGTLSLVRKGYPFLFLDAAVSNLNVRTAQRDEVSTRVALHLPQADSTQRKIFFDSLNQQAEKAGMVHDSREIEALPQFWGPLWSARSEGIDFDLITSLRSCAWTSYESLCRQTRQKADFDYRPVQQQMVFKNSQAEHHLFKKMGLSVPAEAQAAFFSVLVAGV